jgi:hypothetical protein
MHADGQTHRHEAKRRFSLFVQTLLRSNFDCDPSGITSYVWQLASVRAMNAKSTYKHDCYFSSDVAKQH